MTAQHPSASIVIPAHNEAAVIGRLLDALSDGAEPGEFEIVVVANGCTDDTAAVASTWPGVRVLDLPTGSKPLALDAGDAVATVFPRIYVDGDVVINARSVRALVNAVSAVGVHAAAPMRDVRLPDSDWMVRAFYRVWSELPAVRDGLYGRGVLAVDEIGFERITPRPDVLGDDLYVHRQFADAERVIVPNAVSVVFGPKRTADLVRRRIRTVEGNVEQSATHGSQVPSSSGSGRTVLDLARSRPSLWPSIAAFLAVTVRARLAARKRVRDGAPREWLRDESSRN